MMTDPETPTAVGKKTALLQELQNYFIRRRKQLQDWDPAPPHIIGWMVFALATIEISLGLGLLQGESLREALSHRLGGIIFAVIVCEWITTRIGSLAAVYFKKNGRQSTALTFFHIGLIPYLLFLPIAFLAALHGQLQGMAGLLFLLLTLQVLANWRESLEIVYELSSLQSLIVLSSVVGLGLLITVALTYAAFVRILTSAL